MSNKAIIDLLNDVQSEQKCLRMMIEQTHAMFKKVHEEMKKVNKKQIKGVFLENELITHGQNDLLVNMAKLQEAHDIFKLQQEQKMISLQKEVSILTQLFIHGDDIKTYDLSTVFPDAYERIVELEKKRAKKPREMWELTREDVSSSSDDDSQAVSIKNKDL